MFKEKAKVKDTLTKVGEEVTVCGWVDTIRDHGKVAFIDLRDASGIIQVVFYGDNYSKIKDLGPEYFIKIVGSIKEREKNQINENIETGKVELDLKEIQILSKADESPIPISEKSGEVSLSKRLKWRWLDLRKPETRVIFKVWTELERGFREYFEKEDYTQVYTPSLMTSPSESGAEVFEVKYFDRKAYLAQSPQFYKQMALAAGLEKVFMVGPVFRAEPSFTSRHMTEFTGWDFEISPIESHLEVMSEEEGMLVTGFTKVKEKLGLNIQVPTVPFPKIPLREVKAILKKAGIKSEKDGDLSPEEEREICKIVKAEQNHDFVFVTNYPIETRPFYHMRFEEDKTLTKSFDLLYKGLEITTGAQREHRYEILMKQAEAKKMPLKTLEGYFNFFKYGCPPHGGAGIGPGRIVMQMLDLSSVKEATFLPRDVKRLTP